MSILKNTANQRSQKMTPTAKAGLVQAFHSTNYLKTFANFVKSLLKGSEEHETCQMLHYILFKRSKEQNNRNASLRYYSSCVPLSVLS